MSGTASAALTLASYKKNITEIVTRAHKAGVKVMLLTSTMISEDQGKDMKPEAGRLQ